MRKRERGGRERGRKSEKEREGERGREFSGKKRNSCKNCTQVTRTCTSDADTCV